MSELGERAISPRHASHAFRLHAERDGTQIWLVDQIEVI